MTVSQHVYRAYRVGTPDVELSLRSGTITLDDTQAPHVTARLEIARPGHWDAGEWVPDDDVLTSLDRRLGARVRVEVAATFPSSSQTRTFNLALRDRSVPQSDGTVALTLASDEALLLDWAPLADDWTPYTSYQASLRSICNYVLGKIGASLAASPSIDADMTRYWAGTNLMPNPSGEVDASGWVAGGSGGTIARNAGGHVGSYAIRVSNASAGYTAGPFFTTAGAAGIRVTPGTSYTTTCWVRSNRAVSVRLALQYVIDGAGSTPANPLGATVALVANTWTKLSLTVVIPPNVVKIGPYVYLASGSYIAASWIDIDEVMVAETADELPYLDGSLTDSHYTYSWADTANNSTSSRTPVVDKPRDALLWRAGQSGLDFLLPLVQAAGYRLVCDESRTWTLRDETYSASGSLSIAYGVNMIDGSDAITADDDTWFDAQVTVYKDPNGEVSGVDSYALTTPYTKVNLVEVASSYPGPGRSEYAVRRAQGRGREVTATAVSDWRARAEQPLTIVLDGAPTQIGQSSRVQYDLSLDEMTVTARTTDTPDSAWVLLAAGQKWTDSPVGGTWIGEVI